MWQPPVITISALESRGLDGLWQKIQLHRTTAQAAGAWVDRRRTQDIRWMWAMVEDRLMTTLKTDPAVKALVTDLERAIAAGATTPGLAAERILNTFGLREA